MVPFLLLAALGLATSGVTAAVMRRRAAPVPADDPTVAPTSDPTTTTTTTATAADTTGAAGPATDTTTPSPPRVPAPAAPSTRAPARLRSVSERTIGDTTVGVYRDVSPQEAATYARRAHRGRRRTLVTSSLAGGVLALATGVFPVVLWVESHTVPSGVDTTDVVVEGYVDRTTFRSGSRNRARTVVVTPAVDGKDTVSLEYRWLWPDEGDTLEVYPEDGRLRATDEAGALYLVGGLAMTAFWGLATTGWVRHRRREQEARAAYWRSRTHGVS